MEASHCNLLSCGKRLVMPDFDAVSLQQRPKFRNDTVLMTSDNDANPVPPETSMSLTISTISVGGNMMWAVGWSRKSACNVSDIPEAQPSASEPPIQIVSPAAGRSSG